MAQNRPQAFRPEALASHNVPVLLPVAIRVYPEGKDPDDPRPLKLWRRPLAMLVFDTETRTDPTQRLTFGSYRFIVAGRCRTEGLFYGGDLPEKDQKVLERYVAGHGVNPTSCNDRPDLLSLREFLRQLYLAAYKGRCLVVAFNHPFDLSRIAHDYANARRRFAGGFSLGVWPDGRWTDREIRNQFRPRIAIKHIDSRRALIGFTSRREPDPSDFIPEASVTGTPEPDYIFRGHFLDLHTLAFALTNRNYSLEAACKAFGVEHGKQHVKLHGVVTKEYIDYNRRDVLATSELAAKLLEEYDRHPISGSLQETKAYSPASIGKAYLRQMGIKPILERQPDFPKEYLGYAQSAFFGGRTSAHIRKVAVPVVYTDFLSMYPTVNGLMDLWRFVIAREIKVVERCRSKVQTFLERLKAAPEALFKPTTWKSLTAFVRIIPEGDVLPSRARYSDVSRDWQVAVNHLYAPNGSPNDALWFSLPDVAASVLLTGRVPRIIDAFRIEARGVLKSLKPVRLRGAIEVDPRKQDFFKVVIEERKRLSSRSDLAENEKERLGKALKVLANSASYGIYAEMIRQESEKEVKVTCHGIDAEPYVCRVAHPDTPGKYCFPPLAALITGAARLMLALLEHSVSDVGGTYAMEDTDSMAIVATEKSGTVPCQGGQNSAVKVLSWKQVDKITERFAVLNPYKRDAVHGSVLKIEDDNFDPATGKQRQLYCVAISAKRYALFVRAKIGAPILLREGVNNSEDRWSEHGLGHLLNPTNPEDEDREWIAQAWLNIVRKTLGLTTKSLEFAELPAIGHVTVSSPAMMRPFENLNKGKRYSDQIKPFNFLLTCHIRPFGHPPGVNPEHFHLIAPYEPDPRRWLEMPWTDQYSGKTYRITTRGDHGNRHTARVKTYGELLSEYEFHPESKCADAEGKASGKQTVGLLQRRHIRVEQIKYIGKESNSLEEVKAGTVQSAENVYTEYPDQSRDEWETKIRPAMQKVRLTVLQKMTGLSRRMLIDARTGRRRPHTENQKLIVEALRKLGLI